MDRNVFALFSLLCNLLSLSARRAWIEIDFAGSDWVLEFVALRKESVDRNFNTVQIKIVKMVALRKESVDRNGI